MVRSRVFLTSPLAVPTFTVSNLAALKGVQSQANISLLVFFYHLVIFQSSENPAQQLCQHLCIVLFITDRNS